MYVLLAIAIWSYLGFRFVYGRYRTKNYEKTVAVPAQERAESEQEFMNKYSDYEAEHFAEIDGKYATDKHNEVYDLIKDSVGIEPKNYMIYLTVLAMQGKIPKKFLDYGINMAQGFGDQYVENKQWKDKRKFLIWYSDYIQEHGVPEGLIYSKFTRLEELSFEQPNVRVPVDQSPTEITRGKICFASSKGLNNRLSIYIRDTEKKGFFG